MGRQLFARQHWPHLQHLKVTITDLAGSHTTTNAQTLIVDTTPPEALAITAIPRHWHSSDFITIDTTLIVSGTNGALARAKRSR